MGKSVSDSHKILLQKLMCDTREAWRYTGQFTRWNRFKGSFPGLGIATVAFAAYCGYEYMFLNDDHGHGEGGHGEGHH